MKKAAVCFYGLFSIVLIHTFIEPVKAQAIPDTTLSEESSITIPNPVGDLQGSETVIGGARRGTNLFHSFESFSIPLGQDVYFLNPEGVSRIFSRVTGASPSNIQGTLGVLGTSDLFFINSNGILFGPDAQLQVGGSFIASTADAVQFLDGVEFSSTDRNSDRLLTSTVPVGLGLQDAAAITVQNAGREVVDNIFLDEISPRTGLAVLPTQTLALIGGNINLEGGILRTPGGNVELGSVEAGTVGLVLSSDDTNFDYEAVTSFGDINLSRLSFIETSGSPAGGVRLLGQDISLRDGSLVFVRNIGEGIPGNIEVIASESFEIGPSDLSDLLLSGFYSDNFGARGSDVLITAPQVSVLNGGQIFANNYNAGLSGNIIVNARDSAQVDGFNASSERLVSFITSNGFDSADSGSLTLNSGQVRVLNGAQVGTIAVDGAPGDVEVFADDIVVDGSLPTLLKPSILGIATGGTGNSGEFSIETNTLQVLNGGAVGTISIGAGDAGNTSIIANESIDVSGSFPGALNPSSIDSSVTAINPITRVFLQVRPSIALGGRAGSISIETPQLTVQDGGAIRVQNDGPGDAGDLNLDVTEIQIRSGGVVSAETSGGDGGSIDIDSNALLLTEQSAISATAVNSGQGGNVTVDSDAIALLDSSSISANAELGSGGQVIITADALLQSPDSSISATSEVGSARDGVVEVQAPDEAPRAESEIELPAIAVPQVTAVCSGGGGQRGEFTVTGRGGLPTSPNDIQQTYSGWPPTPLPNDTAMPARPSQIAEAQGWLSNGDGTIRFTDQSTNLVNSSPQRTACVNGPASQNRTQNRNS